MDEQKKRKKPVNPRNEWGAWNRMIARDADNIFAPTPKTSDLHIVKKWAVNNPKTNGVKTEATQSSNKWSNTIKHYAKIYEISVLDDKGRMKSVNQLSNEIYDYERRNKPPGGMYPFLTMR
jgi:hypothetical protein